MVTACVQQSLRKDHALIPWFATYEALIRDVVAGKSGDPHSNRTRIHWACDACVAAGRALMADQTKQQYCDCWPYYAYTDDTIRCKDCGCEFVHSKEEQKHWYEALRFWVQSRPIYCKACKQQRKTAGRTPQG